MKSNYLKQITEKPDSILLALVLLIATILRFWRFWDLEFTHDELSAIDRLNYDSWSDFIELGVKPDGHPAGVQLYLKLHKFLFGINEVFVKLPFAILGVFSVYQVFKIGKSWFSSTTGLLAATLFAVSQHSIFYHIIIRPYSPGIFFSLLLIRVWTKIFLDKDYKNKHFAVYGILLACLAYTHYFALLSGVILSFLGLFWIRKDAVLKFIGSGLLSFILFIPNLRFMLDLVSGGELGWLGLTPIAKSLEYYFYIFNFSIPLIFVIGVGLLFYCLKKLLKWENNNLFKKRIVIAILSFFPFIIAQLYSHFIQPVFQYAVLAFSFPCFALIVFSFHEEFSYKFKLIAIGLISGFGIYGLVYYKNHYEIVTHQPFERYYSLISNSSNSLNLGGHEMDMINHYFNHEDSVNIKHYSFKDGNISKQDLIGFLNNPTYEKVITSNIDEHYNSLIACYYPFWEKREMGVFYNNYVFSKGESNDLYYKKGSILPEEFDTTKIYTGEWGVQLKKLEFDSLKKGSHDIIDVFAEVEILSGESDHDLILTMNVKNPKDSLFRWMGASSKDYKGEFTRFFLSNSYNIPHDQKGINDLIIGSVIWNKSKSKYRVLRIDYGVREGNPNLYSLFSKIKD